MKKYIVSPGVFALAGLLMGTAMVAHAQTAGSSINSQLDIGSRGTNVITLQTLLASNPRIYPSGLTTGYFGPLTAQAVAQFQINYGLPAVGRVGPMTLTKLNNILALPAPTLDISAPVIANVSVTRGNTNATLTWTTSESARGTVHFSTIPLIQQEVASPMTSPIISGSFVQESSIGTNHSLSLNSLTPASTYYWIIEAADMAGNVSVTVPATFTTTP